MNVPVTVWTEERKDILREHWPAGTRVDVIKDMLDETAGPPVTIPRISVCAARIGLRRPEGFKSIQAGDLHAGRPRDVWTEERRGILSDYWPAGISTRRIKALLDTTRGPVIAQSSIAVCAAHMGLRRPQWFIGGVPAMAAETKRIRKQQAASLPPLPTVLPAVPPPVPYAGTTAITRAVKEGRTFSMLGGRAR